MTGEHLTELELARLLVADPPPDVVAHAAACARCQAVVDAARADARRFDDEVLPRTLPAVRARAAAGEESWLARLWRPRVLVPALTCLVAAVVLLVARPGDQPTTKASGAGAGTDAAVDQSVGIEGGPAMRVYARRGSLVWQLADGGEVAPGDALRFVVEPAGARHSLIVSRDGAGRHTVYHPFGGDRSAPLPAGAAIELDGSVVLDDELGPEVLYTFLTDQPFTVERALAGLTPKVGLTAGPTPLVFHLVKRAPAPP